MIFWAGVGVGIGAAAIVAGVAVLVFIDRYMKPFSGGPF